jgi:cytochrome d ubiquinol oxidase subunit I
MTDLIAARSQMAMSLGFHIIFAAIGIALPLMMVIAEWRWLRSRDAIWLTLAKRWAKGSAILFAVGAVSGTVLSFELGLLWPRFMAWAGAIIGFPFAMEGFAFFTEAIFLGLYLYGWQRLSPWAHLAAGGMVALTGLLSAIFVVTANAWMNTPTGFEIVDGQPINIDPLAAMANPSAVPEVLHMALAAYAATGFTVAGIHAFLLLRDPSNLFHQRALAIAFAVGAVAAVLQPLSGDVLARAVARFQPVKLAAFEAHFKTEAGAPLRIGGIPDVEHRTVPYSIEIPYALSLLLTLDSHAVVKGLEEFPRENWPPIGIVHMAFQIMVAAGVAMMGAALWGLWRWWNKKPLAGSRPFLWTLVLLTPVGFVAIEAGWTVTEVGRQPWIITGVMRTAEAVTPMPALVVPLIVYTALYCFLAAIVVWLLFRDISDTAREASGVRRVG